MFDFEEARDRMMGAASDGPSAYVICLEDSQAFGSRVFHWYTTEADLLAALTDDFFSLLGEGEEEEDLEKFVAAVAELIAAAPAEDKLSEALRAGMSSLVHGWNVEFIGTYQSLVNGEGDWERGLRKEFRESMLDADEEEDEEEEDEADEAETEPDVEEEDSADEASDAPISDAEVEQFDSFVCTLPWEQ